MSITPSWNEFHAASIARGSDEVMVREWRALEVVPTHTHPFAAEALVVAGEMWLGRNGAIKHLLPGDTFALVANEPHDERYGPDGATYWVARTNDRAGNDTAEVRLSSTTQDSA